MIDDIRRRIDGFARIRLAHLPTPIEPLHRLTDHLGGPPIYVKRDDLTGLGLGGNKVRKLEYLIAEAVASGADCVIATGVIQSNHARQTAAAAAKTGLGCYLLLAVDRVGKTEPEYLESGNVFLDRLFGAEVRTTGWQDDRAAIMEDWAEELRALGKVSYVIPYGGSTPTGALGYANFMIELAEQLENGLAIDHLVVASGTGGTQGGMLGVSEALAPELEIVGIDVDAEPERVASETKELSGAVSELLGTKPGRVEVVGGYAGSGYGVVTEGVREAIDLGARLEGLVMDPVYSGKGMAGVIGLVKDGCFEGSRGVLFVHTGGAPGLFAYRSVLA